MTDNKVTLEREQELELQRVDAIKELAAARSSVHCNSFHGRNRIREADGRLNAILKQIANLRTPPAPSGGEVERVADAIHNVKGGLNYEYADFCRDAALAALAAMDRAPDADNTPHAFVFAAPDTCKNCGNSEDHSVHKPAPCPVEAGGIAPEVIELLNLIHELSGREVDQDAAVMCIEAVEDFRQQSLSAARVEIEGLRKAARTAHDTLIELNPSNYTRDDVCEANAAAVEAILTLADVLGETHGKSPQWWEARRATLSTDQGEG